MRARSRFSLFLRMPQWMPEAVKPRGAQMPPSILISSISILSFLPGVRRRAATAVNYPSMSSHLPVDGQCPLPSRAVASFETYLRVPRQCFERELGRVLLTAGPPPTGGGYRAHVSITTQLRASRTASCRGQVALRLYLKQKRVCRGSIANVT